MQAAASECIKQLQLTVNTLNDCLDEIRMELDDG